MYVLLIEDDISTTQYVRNGLMKAGHKLDVFEDGSTALSHSALSQYDIMIIDRMLPGLDSFALVKAIRQLEIDTPILFLTAITGINNFKETLEIGGNDCLAKPFYMCELISRIDELSRQFTVSDTQTELQVADLSMNLKNGTAERSGKELTLKPLEFSTLEFLMRNEGSTVSRKMLLEKAWNLYFIPGTGVVDTHINRLKSKIDSPFVEPLLHRVRNLGFSLHSRL